MGCPLIGNCATFRQRSIGRGELQMIAVLKASRVLAVAVALFVACGAPASPASEEATSPTPFAGNRAVGAPAAPLPTTEAGGSPSASPTAPAPADPPTSGAPSPTASTPDANAPGPTAIRPTPSSVPSAAAFPPGYDPSAIMFELFSGVNHPIEVSGQTLDLVRANNDTSQVRVIVEIMRFWGVTLRRNASRTLTELTGQDFRGASNEWSRWMEWLGQRPDEFRPPEGYLRWKINLLNIIDPRFEEFLESGEETARIDLTEIAWGGVRPDGIPDLQNAPVIPADEAGYLGPDERVFGVSINGEHRAYPLRIVNPHEMANDVLGGEPIALAY